MAAKKKPITQLKSEVVKKKPRLVLDIPVPQIAKKSGALFVCGQGDMGQLGLGEDQTERKRPALNDAVKNVVDICAGGMHSLCLTNEGRVFSFGCNDEGALGRDTSEEGSDFVPKQIDLPDKCVKVSAGDSHSAYLLKDGRVFACGSFRNSHGNMGLTLEGNKRLPVEVIPGVKSCDIASGADHLIILACSGIVYTIGCAEQGQLGRIALRSASGESRRGKTDLLTPGPVDICKGKLSQTIWATNYCSFVRDINGSKIYAFGLNNYNQLGITKNKEVIIRPVETNLKDVIDIVGGQHHTLILTKDKKCYTVGKKDYGRLGLGPIEEDVESLKEIKTFLSKSVEFISCGDAQSFAIVSDGRLYAWGMGSNYQLGTGSDNDELEPVLITSKSTQNKKFLKVSSGGQHTLFLLTESSAEETTNNIDENINAANKENVVNGHEKHIIKRNKQGTAAKSAERSTTIEKVSEQPIKKSRKRKN